MLVSSFFLALGASAIAHAHSIRVERSENHLIKGLASPDGTSSSSMEPVWHAKQQGDGLVKLDFRRLIQRRDASSADTGTSADAKSTATKDTSVYHAWNNCIGDRGINYRRKFRIISNRNRNVNLKHSIINKHDLNFHGPGRLLLQHDSKEQLGLRSNRCHHIELLCCEYNLEHMFSGLSMHDSVKQRNYGLHGTSE
ncbi:Ff.00g133360.m01.CDS01 [Fusarium sp. VM40]|nr:Ff.00g133360.m01.CDS01 [Fusarium sp. VM40]